MPKKKLLGHIVEYVAYKFKRHDGLQDVRSLRRVMKDRTPPPINLSEENMQPMRDGR